MVPAHPASVIQSLIFYVTSNNLREGLLVCSSLAYTYRTYKYIIDIIYTIVLGKFLGGKKYILPFVFKDSMDVKKDEFTDVSMSVRTIFSYHRFCKNDDMKRLYGHSISLSRSLSISISRSQFHINL